MSFGVPPIKEIKLFHFTSIRNLESILRCGCIKSYNKLTQENITPIRVCYTHIQDRRHILIIPGTMSSLHDFVPFMFAPRSPMLYAIVNNQVPEAQETNQENLIYFVTNFSTIENMNGYFTDYHPTIETASFFSSSADLDKINWELLFENPKLGGYCKFFHNIIENPKYAKRKETRQAEVLIPSELPLENVLQIAVKNDTIKLKVEQMLQKYGFSIEVIVMQEWFF